MDICLPVLKESNKSRFDSNSVKNRVLNISHVTLRDCRVHIFSDNLSRNSCMHFIFPEAFGVICFLSFLFIPKGFKSFTSLDEVCFSSFSHSVSINFNESEWNKGLVI